MSGCRDSQKVKYTAGSFVGKTLTWWNSQIHTRGREAAVGMSWEDFKTLTREEFCPSNEMQKLETDSSLSNPEGKRIERYVYGLAPQIRGMVAATEPKTIQKAVQIADTLTDEALRNGLIKKNPEKRGNGGEPSARIGMEGTISRGLGTGMFLLPSATCLVRGTRVQHPSVPPVTITIQLKHLFSLVSTVTAQEILLRIVEWCLGM
ncbi:hypothetical protein Tco_0738922 [Tanacetum coccineum]